MRKYTVITLMLIVAVLLAGCGKETDLPTSPSVTKGTITLVPDAFVAALNPSSTTTTGYNVYLPPGYDANRATGYPVLYLLHGFGGNEYYFTALFSATDVADKLISEGSIDPMIIVFPSGYNPLGGSFFTNSFHQAVGNSEQHILDIVDEVDGNYNTIVGPEGRGIGGTSMGGFGAVSIAMNNPGVFSSISSLAGPLSFQGGLSTSDASDDAYEGVLELLPTVLLETGYGAFLETHPGGDPDTFRAMIYPSPDRIITSFMFAASAAWSPTPFDLSDPNNPTPIMSESTIPFLPTGDPVFVDLPIGIDGDTLSAVFEDRWLPHDPMTRLISTSPTIPNQAANIAPPAVAFYIDAGESDNLGFNVGQEYFAGAYTSVFTTPPTVNNSNGYEITDLFPGYGALPNPGGDDIAADHTTQTFDRLFDLIQFHADHF